jgi:transposase
LEETITILKKDYDTLVSTIEFLSSENAALRNTVSSLLIEVASLRKDIELLKNGKKSSTSHTPPSQDFARSNTKNSRIKSGKKTGGQLGHKGTTLEMKEIPDEIIQHMPKICEQCNLSLDDVLGELHTRKQEVVIPPLVARFVEHQCYSKTCISCGAQTVGTMPKHMVSNVVYGENVVAMVAYLNVFQYLSYNRIKKLMQDFYGLAISEGTICNFIHKMALYALPKYHAIQQAIGASNIIGGDETGAKIDKQKGWFHVWQNTKLTFIVSSLNRGYATVEKYFREGFPNGIYVSDCWSAQLKIPAIKHQLCHAHLLRELTNFYESFECSWSAKVKILFQKAIKLKTEMVANDYLSKSTAVQNIEQELNELLAVDVSKFHKKQKAFVKRLLKNRQSIFVFLEHEIVPYDNNGSERAIRTIKVKTKVSGCFRSETGAMDFAILRSVIDTAQKNLQNVFDSCLVFAKLRPE